MKKALSIIAAGAAAILLLASCKGGTTSSEMTFNPVTGAGQKTLRVSVPKNDQPEVGNNFGEDGFIKDPQKLLEMFKNNLPAYCEIKLEETKIITYNAANKIEDAVAITALTEDSVTVEWKRPRDNEIGKVGGYIIERYSKTGEEDYSSDGEFIIENPETLIYTDNTLVSDKTYKYEIVAVVDPAAETRKVIVRLDSAEIPEDGKVWELDGKAIEANPANEGDIGTYEYLLTFTFNGIDDYNAKMKAIITEEFWNNYNSEQKAAAQTAGLDWTDILPATLTTAEEDGEIAYTFTEDVRVTELFALRMGKLCKEDTTGAWVDIFGGGFAIEYSQIATAANGTFTLTMLDQTQTFEYNAFDEYTMTVTADSGKTEKSAVENPKTGDITLTLIILAAGFAAGIAIFSLKKSRT